MNEQIQVPMPLAEWNSHSEHRKSYSEYAAERDFYYSAYTEQIRHCVSGLTAYAAQQAATHQDAQLPMLRDLIMQIAYYWRLEGGMDLASNERMDQQYGGGFDQAVAEARQSGLSPEFTDQAMEDILTGLEVHVQEMSTSGSLDDRIELCSGLAQQLRTEWQMKLTAEQQNVLTITMGGMG